MSVQSRNSSFDRFLQSVARIGKKYIPGADSSSDQNKVDLLGLSEQILNCRGEASILALIEALQTSYSKSNDEDRRKFFSGLISDFGLVASSTSFIQELADDQAKYARFVEETRSRRQVLFQHISAAAGGIAFLVNMRSHLGSLLRSQPDLLPIDIDLKTLFQKWFTRGLLELRRIDWDTSANILSKLQKYEAVHRIENWDDLQRRLMTDRRCFGFFHPALVDEPLIFIQVALTTTRSTNIDQILNQKNVLEDISKATHATFYSISNCQDGLRGISFGSFLIKQVSEQLQTELPNLRHFMTLSPLPNFRSAVDKKLVRLNDSQEERFDEQLQIQSTTSALLPLPLPLPDQQLAKLAAMYVIQKQNDKLLDPVARFHLGNGAILDRLNVSANMSSAGMAQSFGVMANYRYDLETLEQNHEKFHHEGTISMSRSVSKLLKTN